MSFQLSAESRKAIDTILTRYPNKRAAALPVLYVVQKQEGYVPEEAEPVVAEILEVPPVKVREVLSFYTLYHRQPIGKFNFQVCRTTSCWMCGAEKILGHLEKKLGIRDGETSEDKQFTLTEVECLGACELAPMMQLNDDYIGNLTIEQIDKIIDDIKKNKK